MTIVAPPPRDRFGLAWAAVVLGLVLARRFVDEPYDSLVLIAFLFFSASLVAKVVRDLRNARPRY